MESSELIFRIDGYLMNIYEHRFNEGGGEVIALYYRVSEEVVR